MSAFFSPELWPFALAIGLLLIVAVLARIGGPFAADAPGAGRTAVGDQGKDAAKEAARKAGAERTRKMFEDPEI